MLKLVTQKNIHLVKVAPSSCAWIKRKKKSPSKKRKDWYRWCQKPTYILNLDPLPSETCHRPKTVGLGKPTHLKSQTMDISNDAERKTSTKATTDQPTCVDSNICKWTERI